MKQRRSLTLLASLAQIQPVFNLTISFDRYGEFASIDKQVNILEIKPCYAGKADKSMAITLRLS